MSYETQLHYLHGIPKTKEDVGPRISLAFRVRPSQPGGPYRGAGTGVAFSRSDGRSRGESLARMTTTGKIVAVAGIGTPTDRPLT
jgi:hypothetical protein